MPDPSFPSEISPAAGGEANARPDSRAPLERAPAALSNRSDLYLKREDVHEIGSFKWRGALPTLEHYKRTGAETVVTASTGNHGAATAWAARRLGVAAIVYVPTQASLTKLELMKKLGADVRHHGADLDEAKEEAQRLAHEIAAPFFEDGTEPTQFEGYAAIGAEIVEALEVPPGAVVFPVGNGALMIGAGGSILKQSPQTLRVGVVASGAPVMLRSWAAGEAVLEKRCRTAADGLAVRVAIPSAVTALRPIAQRMVEVAEADIAAAVAAYGRAGIRLEAAAAASLAALDHLPNLTGPIVLVITGRNIDEESWHALVAEGERLQARQA